eukprot:661401-Pleurochrysis_carterae.AAC.1
MEAWVAARQILTRHCAFGTELMSASSLRDAAHVPPMSWNPSAGPWHCRHCDRDIFVSWAEYEAEKASLSKLKAEKDSVDEVATPPTALCPRPLLQPLQHPHLWSSRSKPGASLPGAPLRSRVVDGQRQQ